MSDAKVVWVRSSRRVPGSDPDDYHAPRVNGPWHVVHDVHSKQTWCGIRLRVLAKEEEHLEQDERPDGRECSSCRVGRAKNQPRAWRRK